MRLASLTRVQRKAYDAAVRDGHSRHVEAEISRRDGTGKPRTLGRVLDWGIDGDLKRRPVETAEVVVLDEDRTLNWSHGTHRHYKVRLFDSRFVPELDEWVEDVIFTGPLWDFDRTGPAVRLALEGSEMLAMGSLRSPFHRPARSQATGVMVDLLTEAGAKPRDLLIPNRKTRLPRDVLVGVERGKDRNKDKPGYQGPHRQVLKLNAEDTYYDPVAEIAEALDGDFFTDGRGRFVLAPARTRSTLRVTEDTLLAEVTEKPTSAGEDTPNNWLVVGADPKGPRGRVSAEVPLPYRHPASPGKMAWNDKPRERTVRIENDKIRTKAQARKVAVRHRDRAMREVVDYEARLLPVVTRWRPGNMVSLPLGGGVRVVARPRRWSIGEDGVTLGANRRRERK